MEFHLAERDQSIKSLVEMGKNGFYPLFHQDWMNDVYDLPNKKMTKKDKIKAKEILSKLVKHKSLERKKIVLMTLSDEERSIFIKAFLDIVENKILNSRPGIQ